MIFKKNYLCSRGLQEKWMWWKLVLQHFPIKWMCLAKELVVLVHGDLLMGSPKPPTNEACLDILQIIKKTRRLHISTGSCLFFITWLIAFANKVGDQLLFGEVSAVVNQVRLPFLNKQKKMVRNIFKKLRTWPQTKPQFVMEHGTYIFWTTELLNPSLVRSTHFSGFNSFESKSVIWVFL